ncbi:MAG: hypothetical protein J0M24_05225 [Verrucomicrobia bacterium]|nr:hypothetical protein [Verrucomicrobiota bacterium]
MLPSATGLLRLSMNTSDFTEYEEGFAVRYYRWAQLEYINLVKSNCADLESFKSGNGWRFRAFMRTLTEKEQLLLGESLLARFHPEARRVLNLKPSPESLALDRRREVFRSSTFSEYDEHPEKFSRTLFVSRRDLRNTITTQFKAALGNNSYPIRVNDRSGDLLYETPCGQFFIWTWFDFGSPDRVLSYRHGVFRFSARAELPVNRPIFGSSRFSFLSWLGISSETTWSYLTHEECVQTGCTVVGLCRRFIDAAPELLRAESD